MNDDWALVLPFDTDDSEFTRGVEVGMVWERLRVSAEECVVGVIVHGSNAEMMLRLSEISGRPVTATDTGDDWLDITFGGVQR